MRFLCVCTYGHSRSVAMARALHGRGLQAVAVGHATCGDAMAPLCAWADAVLLMASEGRGRIPAEHAAKIVDADIGPDRWSNPYNADLAAQCEAVLRRVLC